MPNRKKKQDEILTIVIPCFNEEKNIPILLDNIYKSFREENINEKESCPIKIIIVNNGSTDNTAVVLKSLAGKYSFLEIYSLSKNKGYGYGILQGLNFATTKYIGWSHADLQTDIKDIIKALRIIQISNNNFKIFIKGERKNRNYFDNLFSIGMSLFESILFGMKLYEINAQPTIFHRSLLKNNYKAPFDFSLDLYIYIMAKIKNYSIKRFNVEFKKRIHGTSKWNTNWGSKLKFILRTLNFSFKLRRNILYANDYINRK